MEDGGKADGDQPRQKQPQDGAKAAGDHGCKSTLVNEHGPSIAAPQTERPGRGQFASTNVGQEHDDGEREQHAGGDGKRPEDQEHRREHARRGFGLLFRIKFDGPNREMDVVTGASLVKPCRQRIERGGVGSVEARTGEHEQGTVILAGEGEHLSILKAHQSKHHGVQICKLLKTGERSVAARGRERQGRGVSVRIGQRTGRLQRRKKAVNFQRGQPLRGQHLSGGHRQGGVLSPESEHHLRKPAKTFCIGKHRQSEALDLPVGQLDARQTFPRRAPLTS